MGFCAIDDKTEKKLLVIWDLGRKCTYACSYCPPHRKNNWSATASFEELKKTADALERYSEIYNSKRNERFQVSASFTGGEPTVNPAFFDFLVYLQERYPHWKRTLTTNGFYTDRKLKLVMDNTDYTTLSWHCEGSPDQKKQVRRNIQTMIDNKYGFKVNVMFHSREDYFQECIELCEWLDELGANYIPRVIGDQGDIKQGLDDGTVHRYSDEQMKWFEDYWAKKKGPKVTTASTSQPLPEKKNIGQKIGRPCCGGRDMELLEDNDWVASKFVSNNNFKGWNCMINWYFLYIHQEIDQIWHHQTCQIDMDGNMAPICKVSEFDQYCDKLQAQFDTGKIPFIRCPKSHCGCGLCVPKSKDDKIATQIFKYHAPGIEPELMEMKDIYNQKGSLKHLVLRFDKENGNETI
jgi:MoaA/NifB/PqqE/SkfB family radical SAM enzyme